MQFTTSALPPADNLVPTYQPLLFAPSELRACGLRDAHTHPLVGRRTAAGVRSWRTSPARAWAFPLIEWSRTGNSYAAIGFDCDSREAVERAAASCMGAGDLPTPNVYATRTASGHAQVSICWIVRYTVANKRGRRHSATSRGCLSSTGPH